MRGSSDDEDNTDSGGFGGWRDWLVVLLGVPITIGGMLLAALVGVNAHGSGLLSLPTALFALALAIVVGGLLAVRRR